MAVKPKLKACANCGGHARFIMLYRGSFVVCDGIDCGMMTPVVHTGVRAKSIWNRRPRKRGEK